MTLDDDGNATVVLWGGPSCAAGESLITAHLEGPPYTAVTTGFAVLAPRPTPAGVSALPSSEVEGEVTSSVATIVQVEFPPVFAEKTVDISAEQLYARCSVAPHLVWVGPDEKVLAEEAGSVAVKLDNDGNAFVVALGGASCASGPSEIEASLEEAPYTTYTSAFTIDPPVPTAPAPSFSIEKLQSITGPFETKELTGVVGQTVQYEVIVTNTGNVTETLSDFADAHCEGGEPGASVLAPGESTTFTCSHTLTSRGTWTNAATVVGNGEEKHSNEVIVKVVAKAPEFTIEKLQKIAGAYTSEKLEGAIGETVDYEIVVKNTGNVRLTFSSFTDPNCQAIVEGQKELAPGASTTFTCTHELTSSGTWTNVATLTGNEGAGTETSNEVIVNVPLKGFRIEKLQTISGEYTQAEVTGKVGETVYYEIVVTNIGTVPLTFANFSDGNCEEIVAGESELAPGASTTYTCKHDLTAAGKWVNVASIEGNEGTGTKPSNEVVANALQLVPLTEVFTIVKEQKLANQASYTTNKLTAKVGETVDYRITVTNAGETPETFSHFTDAVCTSVSGGPTGVLNRGESASWTCERTFTVAGEYENVATVTGNATARESNKVAVVVGNSGVKCFSETGGVLRGATGSKDRTFTVRVGAAGIKQITFYLDGRKLKTVKASEAKHGQFEVTINPSKLSYGAHRVSVKAVFSDPEACAKIAQSSVFVRTRSKRQKVKFTG